MPKLSRDRNIIVRAITGNRDLVAVREIEPDDEITYDYRVNGDGDTAWDCSRESTSCRKRHVSGFFHLPINIQAGYFALLEDGFVAEHRGGGGNPGAAD